MGNPSPSDTPASTQTTQVIRFGFDKESKGFISDFYSESLTNGKISAAEIKNALSEFATVQKSTYTKINIVAYLFHAFILLSIVLFALNFGEIQMNMLLFHLLTFGSLCFTFWSILRFMNLLISLLDKQRASKRRAITDKYNKDFSTRGLKWHAPIHSPGLVELWKHYEAPSNPQDAGSMSNNSLTLAPESPIIFYLDEHSQKFDSDFYSPILTGGKVLQGELNDTLAEIEQIRNPIASKAKLMSIWRMICCISMGSFWLIFFWCNEFSGFWLNVSTGVFFVFAAMAWNFREKKKQLEEQWKSKCRVIANQHSKKLAPRGLKWDIYTDPILYIVLQKVKIRVESPSIPSIHQSQEDHK